MFMHRATAIHRAWRDVQARGIFPERALKDSRCVSTQYTRRARRLLVGATEVATGIGQLRGVEELRHSLAANRGSDPGRDEHPQVTQSRFGRIDPRCAVGKERALDSDPKQRPVSSA
jgi:hypothetical protein